MTNKGTVGQRVPVGAGFTLIELIVVMAVMAIISTTVFRYVVATSELYAMLKDREEVDQEIACATVRMRREARLLKSTTLADESDWGFVNSMNVTSRFRLADSSLTMNDCLLATGVQDFRLSYFDSTNGPLAPMPLGSIDMSLVRRVSAEMTVGRRGHTSTIHTVFFYPEKGITK